MFLRVKAVFGLGLLLAGLCAAPSAQAGGPPNLRAFLFGAARRDSGVSMPPVARYESDRGEGFVFDRTQGTEAVIKFDGSPERWALFASPGPRGDVIYKNDMGDAVLRATRLGGLTLFTNADPEGIPAAPLGVVAPPRLPPVLGPEALLQILVQASGRASHAAQHLIIFDATDAVATPSTEPVFADAFVLTADAIVRVCARGKSGVAAAAKVNKVLFRQGRDATAALRGPMVLITIAPEMGVAGRPSSERIAAALLRH